MGATGSQSHPPRPVPPTVQCPLARAHCVRCVCVWVCVWATVPTKNGHRLCSFFAGRLHALPGASAHLPPTRKEGRKRRPLRLAAHIRPSHPPALSPPSIHQHQHYSIQPPPLTLTYNPTTHCYCFYNPLPTLFQHAHPIAVTCLSTLLLLRNHNTSPYCTRTVAFPRSHTALWLRRRNRTTKPPNRPTTQIVNNSNRVSHSTISLLLRYTNRNHAPPLSALLRLIAALSIPSPAISLLSSRQPPGPLVAKRPRQHHVHLPQPPVSSRLTRANRP